MKLFCLRSNVEGKMLHFLFVRFLISFNLSIFETFFDILNPTSAMAAESFYKLASLDNVILSKKNRTDERSKENEKHEKLISKLKINLPSFLAKFRYFFVFNKIKFIAIQPFSNSR